MLSLPGKDHGTLNAKKTNQNRLNHVRLSTQFAPPTYFSFKAIMVIISTHILLQDVKKKFVKLTSQFYEKAVMCPFQVL